MLTRELLLERKDDLQNLAVMLRDTDLDLLIDWLKEKDDTLRYAVFQMLQLLSERDDRVYKHWESFAGMVGDANSYQRSLGLMLMAGNVRWDQTGKFGQVCLMYLEHCDDEKFITARQCIQGLQKVITHTGKYREEIIAALVKIDLSKRKDTQRGLMLLDLAGVLGRLHEEQKDERIEQYLRTNLEFGNEKARKEIKKILGV